MGNEFHHFFAVDRNRHSGRKTLRNLTYFLPRWRTVIWRCTATKQFQPDYPTSKELP
jgi:hypothetical protein